MIEVRVRSLSRGRNEGESYGYGTEMEVNLKFAEEKNKRQRTTRNSPASFHGMGTVQLILIQHALKAKGIFSYSVRFYI